MKSLFLFAILFLSANALSLAPAARHHQLARQLAQRSNNSRCKSRSTSSTLQYTPTSTPAAAPSPSFSPTPSPSPSPSPPQSPSPPSGSKAGVAWSQSNNPALGNFMVPGRVLYTWTPDKPSDTFGGQFAGMLRPNQLQSFQQLVKPGYADYALGFNEPELSSQDNLSPGAAVSLWWQYMGPLMNQGIKFGSPAVTSVPDVSIPWLQSFIAQCNGCQIDFVCMHYYGTDAQDFITYVTKFHQTFNKPVWVTEFAPWNFDGTPQIDQQQVNAFMETVTQWMDSTDMVEHYFPFGVMPDMGSTGVGSTCQLMNADGTLNALAEIAF